MCKHIRFLISSTFKIRISLCGLSVYDILLSADLVLYIISGNYILSIFDVLYHNYSVHLPFLFKDFRLWLRCAVFLPPMHMHRD